MKEKKVKNVEVEEDFYDEKKKTKKEVVYVEKKPGIISRIINIIFWLILFAWMAIVLVDYFKVRDEKEPIFCWFNEQTHEYENGTVKECTGLGYKVINYNREDFKAIEFGPFWIKDRTAPKTEK